MDTKINAKLTGIYDKLGKAYGPQHWWPGDGPFEMMAGAILTQSAAWTNVEKAVSRLKEAGALSPEAVRSIELSELAALVYSSGYHNAKARKLKALAEWLRDEWGDDLPKMFAADTAELRKSLLSVWGVGEETADSILLYAAKKPVFVIDAYTRRIIDRLGLKPEGDSYTSYQSLFMDNLPFGSSQDQSAAVELFNEYHALLVCLAKNVCRKKPLCGECCLRDMCCFPSSVQAEKHTVLEGRKWRK